MKRPDRAARIPLGELVDVHPEELKHRPTEWLCRAKEQIARRCARLVERLDTAPECRLGALDLERVSSMLARPAERATVVEAELSERMARTLADLPDLTKPPLSGYRAGLPPQRGRRI